MASFAWFVLGWIRGLAFLLFVPFRVRMLGWRCIAAAAAAATTDLSWASDAARRRLTLQPLCFAIFSELLLESSSLLLPHRRRNCC